MSELQHSVIIDHSKSSRVVDVFLDRLPTLMKYQEVQCSLSIYPLAEEVTADDFEVTPYEDYVRELSAGRRSTYTTIQRSSNKVFGLAVGVCIAVVFWWLAPELLFTVEAVVAVIGAYALSKELWSDFEDALVRATKQMPLRWVEDEFFYVREDFGTLQRFWQLAREHRSGYQHTLPRKLDFIAHSNSKTIDMSFSLDDLHHLQNKKVKVASVRFSSRVNVSLSKNVMIIVRVTTVKRMPFGLRTTEYYQVLDQGKVGTIDKKNLWHTEKVLVKKAFSVGKIRWAYKPKLEHFLLLMLK